MKIISFDQATVSTGYAIFESSELVKWGAITAKTMSGDYVERMRQIYADVCKLLDENKPDFATIEDVEYRKNFKTYKQLANLQGVFLAAFYDRGVQFQILHPSTWRKAIGFNSTSKRAEQKADAIALVKKDYGVDCNDDVAEAILQGLAAAKLNSKSKGLV